MHGRERGPRAEAANVHAGQTWRERLRDRVPRRAARRGGAPAGRAHLVLLCRRLSRLRHHRSLFPRVAARKGAVPDRDRHDHGGAAVRARPVHALSRPVGGSARELPPRHHRACLERRSPGARAQRALRLLADPDGRRRLPLVHGDHAAADRDGGGRRRSHGGARLRPHAAVGIDHVHRGELRRRRADRGARRRLRHLAHRIGGRADGRRRPPAARAAGQDGRRAQGHGRIGACRSRCGCSARGRSCCSSWRSAAPTARTRRSTRSARCTGSRRGSRRRGSERCGPSASPPR